MYNIPGTTVRNKAIDWRLAPIAAISDLFVTARHQSQDMTNFVNVEIEKEVPHAKTSDGCHVHVLGTGTLEEPICDHAGG